MKSRYKPPKLTQQETNAVYKACANEVAKSMIAAALLVLHQRKWHKKDIVKFYDDILAILSMPPVMGKDLNDYEVVAYLEKLYGIDFKKIDIKLQIGER